MTLKKDAGGQIFQADLLNNARMPLEQVRPNWQDKTCGEGHMSRGQPRHTAFGRGGSSVPQFVGFPSIYMYII